VVASLLVPGLATALWASALGALGAMVVAFLVGRLLDRYRDVDVFWPLAYVVIAGIDFAISEGQPGTCTTQRTLLLVLTAVWGLRLAGYLAWRSRGAGEDPRYEAILSRAKGSKVLFSLIIVYLFQATLAWWVSLCLTVGMFARSPLVVLEVVGALVWALGFAFESIGDAQLRRFSLDPANRGRVLDRGLWSWTRHPNYFGDACVWWGLFVIAAAGGWGALTVLSPLLMNVLLVRVSGKVLTERRMKRTREGFAEYVERTSGFVPRPPRRLG
jgi:steroid 5-alpha reductase family enzyme